MPPSVSASQLSALYAARAGGATRYPWGDDVGQKHANCKGCGSNSGGLLPARVGSFATNRFGLHDMAGNVWEWVEDCWNDRYTVAPGWGQPAWTSGDCRLRALCGGSWYSEPVEVRSASRGTHHRGYLYLDTGFRVARTLP